VAYYRTMDTGAASLAAQIVSRSENLLQLRVEVAVLKKQLDLQKETAAMLLDLLGVGGTIDVEA
jgi:hypothetical protein